MVIPSTAKLGNIIGGAIGLGSWNMVDHDTGLPFCSFDSFYSFQMTSDSNVSQYPIEGGSFRYWNKDDTPSELEVTLVKSGLTLPGEKKKFVKTLQQYVGQPRLVDISTTSQSYIGYTINKMQFTNMPDDCSDILMINLSLTEVRIKAGMKTTKPKAADRVKAGFKQLVGI